MPLSEHEQRILAELEESLNQQDPNFAERVANETVYRHAGRQCKWAALTFILGLVVLIAFYSASLLLGLAGVAIMFASAVVFERNLRRMGKASWHDITRSLHEEEPSGAAGGIESTVHDVRNWFRGRFQRRED
jgi:Flp pilus assembly protein TadB